MQYRDIKEQKRKHVDVNKDPFSKVTDENAELLIQSAKQDMAIQKLQDENAELLLKVAVLDGGIF